MICSPAAPTWKQPPCCSDYKPPCFRDASGIRRPPLFKGEPLGCGAGGKASPFQRGGGAAKPCRRGSHLVQACDVRSPPAELDGEFYGTTSLEIPAKAGISRILQSVSLRETAPLSQGEPLAGASPESLPFPKGSLFCAKTPGGLSRRARGMFLTPPDRSRSRARCS